MQTAKCNIRICSGKNFYLVGGDRWRDPERVVEGKQQQRNQHQYVNDSGVSLIILCFSFGMIRPKSVGGFVDTQTNGQADGSTDKLATTTTTTEKVSILEPYMGRCVKPSSFDARIYVKDV